MLMNQTTLMRRIEELSEEIGKSLNVVFTESGVGKNFKSNTRYAKPSIGKITMLANYFDVSVDYLLGNTDVKEKPSAKVEELPANTVVMRGRDGSVITRHLSDAQVKALQSIIDQLPDAPDDL